MLNVKNKKFVSKKWPILLSLFLVCALAMSFLLYKFVIKLPEKELAKNFLSTNDRIMDLFGKPLSVQYGGNGSKVSFRKKKLEGSYSFTIKGAKKTGVVQVKWHSKGSGIDFKADSIEFLEPWKDPVLIWPREQQE